MEMEIAAAIRSSGQGESWHLVALSSHLLSNQLTQVASTGLAILFRASILTLYGELLGVYITRFIFWPDCDAQTIIKLTNQFMNANHIDSSAMFRRQTQLWQSIYSEAFIARKQSFISSTTMSQRRVKIVTIGTVTIIRVDITYRHYN